MSQSVIQAESPPPFLALATAAPKPGQTVDLAGVVGFLEEHKVARNYMPEKVLLRDAMPATPSGKIQKFKLRESLKTGGVS